MTEPVSSTRNASEGASYALKWILSARRGRCKPNRSGYSAPLGKQRPTTGLEIHSSLGTRRQPWANKRRNTCTRGKGRGLKGDQARRLRRYPKKMKLIIATNARVPWRKGSGDAKGRR